MPKDANPSGAVASRVVKASRSESLLIFPLKSIQNLDMNETARCQQLLGHGNVIGTWETPLTMAPHLRGHMRSINLRKRIVAYLPDGMKLLPASLGSQLGQQARLDMLLDEAVLYMSRYALLIRMSPTCSGYKFSRQPLDVTTIAQKLYKAVAKILAISVARRFSLQVSSAGGFVTHLTEEELCLLREDSYQRAELDRIARLCDMELWSDEPKRIKFEGTETNPRGAAKPPKVQEKPNPYQHIPDDYMTLIGPRVVWVIRNLGPRLIEVCERIPHMLDGDSALSDHEWSRTRGRIMEAYLQDSIVFDAPPFVADTGVFAKLESDSAPWHPKQYQDLKKLAGILQGAHLFILLLSLGGRVSEIATLNRGCVEFARDGKCYANGKTYKLSSRFDGAERTWGLPDIAVDALAQQVRLVETWERIARQQRKAPNDSKEPFEVEEGHLWGSMWADPEKALASVQGALYRLAEGLGVSRKPGGKNLHPHRFRKTIARLVAVAIVNSSRLLQLVFGHKDIQMTLYYIRSDKALAVEIEKMTRELKIMRCEKVVEDLHAACEQSGLVTTDGYGGPGAEVMANAVESYADELHQKGEKWGASSAHELAEILTASGRNWTLVTEHTICSKGPGEAGLCSKKLGDPVVSNCQSECINRIEEKTGRRDVHRIIPILVTNWKRARDDRQLLVMAGYEDQLRHELARFPDIGATMNGDPEVALIMEARP